MANMIGGDKLKAKLDAIAKQLQKNKELKVGFFSGSMEEKSNVPTAYVAYVNEYGGTVPERTVPAHKSKIYRRVDKKGNFTNKGKFVKSGKSNLTQEVLIPEHTIPEHNIPARPFFRNMIRDGEGHWAEDLGKALKTHNFNVEIAMVHMGKQMADELRESIQAPGYATLKKSTIQKKGHDQTLIESGDMLHAVNFQVED